LGICSNKDGSNKDDLLCDDSVTISGKSSITTLLRCLLALARSAIQDGCPGGGGVGLGFSSTLVIFDSSQLDLVGLHLLDGLGGDVNSGLLSSPISDTLFNDTIDFERL
jgi:hypothetical protein